MYNQYESNHWKPEINYITAIRERLWGCKYTSCWDFVREPRKIACFLQRPSRYVLFFLNFEFQISNFKSHAYGIVYHAVGRVPGCKH